MNVIRIAPSEWTFFYKLFGSLLAAGHSPVESLSQLAQEPFPGKFTKRLTASLAALPPTASLADCLKLKVFALDAATLGLFETSAPLEDHIGLLRALSARYAQANWVNRLRGNSLYWALLYFGVIFAVTSCIFIFVLPVFAGFYQDMGGALPGATAALLASGHQVLWLLPVLMLIFLALRYRRPAWLRPAIDRLRLIRPWGLLTERIARARFNHMLAQLLADRLPARLALPMAATACANTVIERRLHRAFAAQWAAPDAAPSVAGMLKACFAGPNTFAAALSIAEKAPQPDAPWPELIDLSADLLRRHTQLLGNLVDTALIFLICCFVFGAVSSVYLPLFSLGVLI